MKPGSGSENVVINVLQVAKRQQVRQNRRLHTDRQQYSNDTSACKTNLKAEACSLSAQGLGLQERGYVLMLVQAGP